MGSEGRWKRSDALITFVGGNISYGVLYLFAFLLFSSLTQRWLSHPLRVQPNSNYWESGVCLKNIDKPPTITNGINEQVVAWMYGVASKSIWNILGGFCEPVHYTWVQQWSLACQNQSCTRNCVKGTSCVLETQTHRCTDTHVCAILVRTLTEIMHSPAPYPNPNHQN